MSGRPPARIGPYEVRRELGRGGMGVVYEARDVGLGRDVAVKLLGAGASADATHRARFQREARALARLEHPHIVRVLATGEHGGAPYLVMDLVRGGSLQERIEQGGPLPVAQAVELARKLARALGHAHAMDVVHRDVKPSNVLIDEWGEPLLTDFGVAKDLASGTVLSVPGRVVGTLGYCAPEQGRGDHGKVGPASDVFGLGATLFFALTGAPPFAGDSLVEVIASLHAPPTPPSGLRPEVPPELDAVVLRALAADPAERFASMNDLLAALERDPAPRRPTSRRPATSPRRGLVAALAVSSLAGWGGLAAHVALQPARVDRARADGLREGRVEGHAASEAAATAARAEVAAAREAAAAAEAARSEADAQAVRLRERLVISERERAALEARVRALEAPPRPRPDEGRSPAMFDIIAHVNRSQWTQALPLLDALLAQRPRDAEALGVRAMCRVNLGDPAGALSDADRALALRPDTNASFARAWVRLGRGELRAGAQDLDALLAVDAGHAQARAMRAQARLFLGDPRGVLEDAEVVLRKLADDPGALGLRGCARVLLGEREAGLADCERAVRLDPRDGGVWMYRGYVRFARQELDAAQEDLDRSLALVPEVSGARFLRGNIRYRRGDLVGAAADLRQVVEVQPRAGHAWRELARVLDRQGERAAADAAAARAVELGEPADQVRLAVPR